MYCVVPDRYCLTALNNIPSFKKNNRMFIITEYSQLLMLKEAGVLHVIRYINQTTIFLNATTPSFHRIGCKC